MTHSTSFWGSFFVQSYFQLGVIPVVGKRPKIKNWQRGGLKAFESIHKVFGRIDERHPGRLAIGIPTGFPLRDGGHLLVVDVDERNGGREALSALPALPETAMVKTKDGEHYYFRTVCSAPSLVRPDGIELKGAGSYVVIPPSPDKEWLRQAHDCPIASAPEWLTATPPRTKAEVIPVWRQPMTGETSLLQGPVLDPPGNRHNSLLNWAGRYAYRGWTSKAHALLLINSAIRAGLEHDDALRLIDFAFRTIQPGHAWPSPGTEPGTGPGPGPGLTRTGTGTGGEAGVHTGIVALAQTDAEVLKVALEAILSNNRGKWTYLGDAWLEVLSCRFLAGRVGCHHVTASRSLARICQAGMLWRSPKPYRLSKSGLLTYQYRPTWFGVATAARYLGVNPWRAGPRP